MEESLLVTQEGSCPPGSEWATYPRVQELRPRGVTRNPVKAEMISQRRQETRVTCEVGHPPDEPFLVRIIPVVDAVVDYVILRRKKS